MKKNRYLLKIISVVLTVAFVVMSVSSTIGAFAQDEKSNLHVASISDIHYFSADLTDNYCDAFVQSCVSNIGKEALQSVGILESALAGVAANAKANDTKYLLIPGDITSNGEYKAAVAIASRLEKFEAETGIQVIVINGNHDINRAKSLTFENGKEEVGRTTTPQEFREIYKNLGYDLAYHTYTPENGQAGQLSYSVKLDGGFRLICMDLAKYSSDVTADGTNVAETGGGFTQGTLDWAEKEIADAQADGETPVGMTHFSISPHYNAEYTTMSGFVIDNYEEIGSELADCGMHYVFTGHIHNNDIAETVSDNGETIYDITTASLTTFPNYYRETTFERENEKITFNVKSYDVDCVENVVVNGVAYDKPFRKQSLDLSFSGGDWNARLTDILDGLLTSYGSKFEKGKMVEGLKTNFGIDLEELLGQYFGSGLVVNGQEIFTTKNLLSFIEDLLGQVYDNYLSDPEATAKMVIEAFQPFMNLQLSEIPASKFTDEYGIGSKTRPGTFMDMMDECIIYLYGGDEDISDDAFIQDVLKSLEAGKEDSLFFDMFDSLVDVLVKNLVQDKILSKLNFNVEALFPDGSFGEHLGTFLGCVVRMVFLGDTSYENIADSTLAAISKTGLVEYDSLWSILEHYMNDYLTTSQLEGLGQAMAQIIRDFIDDDNSEFEDSEATLVYNGKVDVSATQANLRLPSGVAVTFGENTNSRNISWVTKSSITATDVELVPYSENATFKGESSVPLGVTVKRSAERVTRTLVGVNVGKFIFLNHEFPATRHIINISGLKAGTKYSYRVGNAAKGWWSETGTIEIEDSTDTTSFIHVSDQQSQSAQQYETFSNVLSTAFKMFPQSKFIINTGDNTDNGDDFKEWQWMFNTASSTLMNTVMMSASGNHEGYGTNAIVDNYAISNAPEQDVTSGIYYSFDYNNVHFAVLNSNDLDEDTNGLSDKQIEWLKNDMNNSDKDWKFVAIHKAAYSDGSHYKDKDVKAIRKQLSTLMPQLGIDMVFQGHDHVYLRTDVMDNNKVVAPQTETISYNGEEYAAKINPQGSIYVISGCSGVKNYKQKDASLTDKYFPRAQAIYDADCSVFSSVQIVDDTLYFNAYTVDGESVKNIDRFAIEKDLDADTEPETDSVTSIIKDIVVKYIWPAIKELATRLFAIFKGKEF